MDQLGDSLFLPKFPFFDHFVHYINRHFLSPFHDPLDMQERNMNDLVRERKIGLGQEETLRSCEQETLKCREKETLIALFENKTSRL